MRSGLLLTAMTVARIAGAQDTWIGGPFPAGTNWTNGDNWSYGHAPNPADDAAFTYYGFDINIESGFPVVVNNFSASDVSIENHSTFDVSGNFDYETVTGSNSITGLYTSGLGSVSNIGTAGSTINIAGGPGIQGVTVQASSGGAVNIVGSSITISGYSYLTVSDAYSCFNANSNI